MTEKDFSSENLKIDGGRHSIVQHYNCLPEYQANVIRLFMVALLPSLHIVGSGQ
jgi:hypothetical protein